jgi:hypothetical protein
MNDEIMNMQIRDTPTSSDSTLPLCRRDASVRVYLVHWTRDLLPWQRRKISAIDICFPSAGKKPFLSKAQTKQADQAAFFNQSFLSGQMKPAALTLMCLLNAGRYFLLSKEHASLTPI